MADASASSEMANAASSGSGGGGGGDSARASSSSASAIPSALNGPRDPGGPDRNNSKRRRGLGVVTPNACTECRKKRAKCDGQKPCTRCKAQGGQAHVDCVYEIPVRQSKDNLRNEIEQLRQRQRSNEQVFAALVRPGLWQEVLQRLQNRQTVDSISDWLGSAPPSGASSLAGFVHSADHGGGGGGGHGGSMAGRGFGGAGPSSMQQQMNLGVGGLSPVTAQHQAQMDDSSSWHFSSHSGVSTRSGSHPDLMNWQPDAAPPSRVGSWTDQDQQSGSGAQYQGADQILAPVNPPDLKVPAATWTSITADVDLVQHLLALYFCWEYPTFASLSKEHFLRDFQEGINRYCSPILVNALLALGCRFSSQPSTRANPNDPYTSGDHFFKESLRLFHLEEDHRSLTTIQALGIMSIREASSGRDSESWYYAGQSIRIAIEMGLHRINDQGDEDEVAVQAATFWGAFALDHAWSLATGSLPQCSCFPLLPPKPAIIGDIEASKWEPYTDDGARFQRQCVQPSNVRSVYKCFCELSELVHQSLYILHSPGRPFTSRELLEIYTKYLNWYDSIPEVLRLGHNFTPAVLFAHMYYHFAILLLFRPLIKLRIVGSKVLPKDVCCQAADAIQGLLRSYASLYTLRRTPSFVPYFVLTSAIMHLAIAASSAPAQRLAAGPTPPDTAAEAAVKTNPQVSKSIKQGIDDLEEMAPCHHFAEQALNILRFLARKWKIKVDLDDDGDKEGRDKLEEEEYDRIAGPYTTSLNFFAPNIKPDDFICSWGGRAKSAGGDGGGGAGGSGGAGGADGGVTPGRHVGGNDSSGSQSSSATPEQAAHRVASAMENPLFWPFPMQGRPMMPSGQGLHEAGFAFL